MLLEPISSIATPHVFSLDARQSVQAAVDLMAAHGVQDIIVTGNPELRIITAQHIIPLRLDELDFSTPLAAIELPVVACLPSDASIASALGALQQSPTESHTDPLELPWIRSQAARVSVGFAAMASAASWSRPPLTRCSR